jgi:uncharacterized protein (DUF983 family)
MEADDEDLPASYVLYIIGALVVIGIAAVSAFFILSLDNRIALR